MEPDALVTIAFGFVVLGFILYLFRYYREKPDFSEVPEVFKEEPGDDFEEDEDEEEEEDEDEMEDLVGETGSALDYEESDDSSGPETQVSPDEIERVPTRKASSPEEGKDEGTSSETPPGDISEESEE